MKVYVTQGYEQGIGLEVFFKSCLLMRKSDLTFLKLLAFENSVSETLKSLKLPFSISQNVIHLAGTNISVEWLQDKVQSQSFSSLKQAMKYTEKQGVLFTLPTSKDQFPGYPGHTEYFRAHYQRPELVMFFSSPKLQVLLLSDHLPINRISEVMTEEIIFKRLSMAITTLKQWNWPIKKILISGMNPHAGENGLIGHEDQRITAAIRRLTSKLKIDMAGPIPGDTMLLEKRSPQDLLVYMFHDQGLGVFKGLQGFIGSNITLGLPYPRFSPDHGTSFGLYGQNIADYRGCAFALKEAVKMLKKVTNGKNSSH
jgi:4-hydroxythreonine-4-phosphate dehydrogenase